MAKKNKGAKEPRRLRVEASAASELNVDPSTIPTTVPESALKLFMDGDEDPYYKIEAIEYPVKANGAHYQESFFEEYIAVLADRPIPGSKDGHHIQWGKRAPTDMMVVGAKINKTGDGTGVVFLKNYIPPAGAESSNETFLKEAKAGMIHFSLVSYTRDEYEETPDGDGIWNVVGSLYGERNDAVEWGTGAMTQRVTNKETTGDEPDEGDEIMTKEELLKKLSAMKANGDITISEIAKTLGIEIVTDVHTDAVKQNAEVVAVLGEAPVEAAKALQEKVKADETAVFNARMDKEFGAAKHEDGSDNLVRLQADSIVANGPDLEDQIAKAKENAILKKLKGDELDVTTGVAPVGLSDKKTNSGDGPVEQKY